MNVSKKTVYSCNITRIISIISSLLLIACFCLGIVQIIDFPIAGSNEIFPKNIIIHYYACNIIFLFLLFILPANIVFMINTTKTEFEKKTVYYINDKEVSKKDYDDFLKCSNISTIDTMI